jgi:hypothetical protein
VRIPIKRKIRNCNCIKMNCRVEDTAVLCKSTVVTKRTSILGQEAVHWDSVIIIRPEACSADSLTEVTSSRIVFWPVHDLMDPLSAEATQLVSKFPGLLENLSCSCLHEFIIGIYRETDKSNPHTHTDSFKINLSSVLHLHLVFPSSLFP